MAKFRFAQWLWDWLFAVQSFSFEWDAGNSTKSIQKHGVSCREAEEVFLELRSFHSENSTSHNHQKRGSAFWARLVKGNCFSLHLPYATRRFE